VTKFKHTAEDHLWFLRLLRAEKGLRNREGKHYLKELRKERGLTQAQLAERADCSQQFISRIESNWVNVGHKTVERLSRALDMDPRELALMEVIYRQTLAREYPSFFGGEAEPVEELDVDRWSLAEAIGGVGMQFSHLDLGDYDEEDYWEDTESETATDRAYDVLRRLEDRYGSRWWD
jgi:transcriptional regulator with XRE-family HTH domain